MQAALCIELLNGGCRGLGDGRTPTRYRLSIRSRASCCAPRLMVEDVALGARLDVRDAKARAASAFGLFAVWACHRWGDGLLHEVPTVVES